MAAVFKGNENFHFTYHVDGLQQFESKVINFESDSENMEQDYLPSYPNLIWYWDMSYTIPCVIGEHLGDYWGYFTKIDTSSLPITYYVDLYGRIEFSPIKVLTESGVKALYNLLSLQDYPNNDILMAVINAIDETKADKSDITALQKALENKANSGHNHYAQAITQGTLSVDRLPTIPTSKLPMDDIYNELISRLPVAEEASF